MHLADAFIQSDLQCIQVIHVLSACAKLCKIHFYEVFEHRCVSTVCENNKPIMVNNPPTPVFCNPHKTYKSLQMSGSRFHPTVMSQ